MLEDADGNVEELCKEGHCKLLMAFGAVGAGDHFVALFYVDTIELFLDLLALVALFPNLMPILRRLATSACAYYLEHELGWILLGATFSCPMGFEIVEKSLGIVADITKVDGPFAFGKEEQPIKFLKQNA